MSQNTAFSMLVTVLDPIPTFGGDYGLYKVNPGCLFLFFQITLPHFHVFIWKHGTCHFYFAVPACLSHVVKEEAGSPEKWIKPGDHIIELGNGYLPDYYTQNKMRHI